MVGRAGAAPGIRQCQQQIALERGPVAIARSEDGQRPLVVSCRLLERELRREQGNSREKKKARFYRIARRSATESAAVLDVARALEAADGREVSAGKELLLDIVGSLIGLSRKMEGEAKVR
jgi:hypothetical protein